MEKDAIIPDNYRLFRMLPPGSLTYFYSNGGQEAFTDPKKSSILNQDTLISNEHITMNVPKLNYIENIKQLKQLYT